LRRRLRTRLHVTVVERAIREVVKRADLSLLKGRALMERYARFARNPHRFHNTSYLSSEMAREEDVERRLASVAERRPLRLVYCGRLVARKGVARSVEIIRRARALGADVRLTVLGGGPEEPALRARIAQD